MKLSKQVFLRSNCATMWIILLWLVQLPASLEQAGNVPMAKVAGGDYVNVTEYPHQVLLMWMIPSSQAMLLYAYCGAAVIGRQWVLTSAHCIHNGTRNIKMRMGISDLTEDGYITNITLAHCHPNFDRQTYPDNDVCLLRTPEPIPFSEVIQPIKLATSEDEEFVRISNSVNVSGFGRVHPFFDDLAFGNLLLKATNITIVDINDCVQQMEKVNSYRDRAICARDTVDDSTGACKGDSGGSMVAYARDGKRVALGLNQRGDCFGGQTYQFISVFTRISSYLTWINQALERLG